MRERERERERETQARNGMRLLSSQYYVDEDDSWFSLIGTTHIPFSFNELNDWTCSECNVSFKSISDSDSRLKTINARVSILSMVFFRIILMVISFYINNVRCMQFFIWIIDSVSYLRVKHHWFAQLLRGITNHLHSMGQLLLTRSCRPPSCF